MTNEETVLVDKLLKEATETTNPIHRANLIDNYSQLVKACFMRREATTNLQSCMTATGMVPTGSCSEVWQ
jgi:hypothetical protein